MDESQQPDFYLIGHIKPYIDERLYDLIHKGGMPAVTSGFLATFVGYQHAARPELHPYEVQLFGIPEPVYLPPASTYRVTHHGRRQEDMIDESLRRIVTFEIDNDEALAVMGSRAVHYRVGETVKLFIWLARLRRAVLRDGKTSMALTRRNYKHARFSPVVHEELYYRTEPKIETIGGEFVTGAVDYHTVELMRGYDLLAIISGNRQPISGRVGPQPKYTTQQEMLDEMNKAAMTLKPYQQVKQDYIARELGLSKRGFTDAMTRLGINYIEWRKEIEITRKRAR